MTKNIYKLFENLQNIEPSTGLKGKIFRKIALEKNWQTKKRLIFADALMLGSLGAFVFMLMNFWNGIAKSEFWSLLRLIFTDAGIVTSHWMDFAFSLLETFPAIQAAVILAPVFLLLMSANLYFKSAGNNRAKACI
ncbi:MAG: hypothetical protein WC726_00320 [Parcubacteria group bacterium]|jgi:hypothetical protein